MSTNKKPKVGAAVAKIIFGLLFLDVAIAPDPEFEAPARGIAVILGIALLLWAYYPFRKWKKYQALLREEMEREDKEIDALKAALKNRSWACPQCGANTKGDVCEYCGSAKPRT